MSDRIEFAGITFRGTDSSKLFNACSAFYMIVTVNSEMIVRAHRVDSDFRTILEEAICTFDGQLPFMLARLKYWLKGENAEFSKVSGSDFIYDVAKHCQLYNKKLFLLGGDPDSNAEAVNRLSSIYGIEVNGFSPPYSEYPFPNTLNEKILTQLGRFQPDFLAVGFGAEKQERWIYDNSKYLRELGVTFAVGTGGTFDFVAGKVKRAPKLLRNLCLEGVFRFAVEPKFFRWKRLLTSLKVFRYITK